MIETAATVGIAGVAGIWALTKNLYDRLDRLDRRLDRQELKVAEQYVTKNELREVIEEVSGHCVRIENKLDRLLLDKDR
jgi:uncharacterized coiled-coil protein SlyX